MSKEDNFNYIKGFKDGIEAAARLYKEDNSNYIKGFKNGIEAAAKLSKEWGDVSAGGSGEEIIPSGPSKGQRYGEGYYNLANSIRRIEAKV